MEELAKTKLILGTVQIGLNYGINNSTGKPSQKDVFGILDLAHEQKIESLDTAESYGNAIEQIGLYHKQRSNRFKILSKFNKVRSGELFERASNSLKTLQITSFEVYSYHSFSDYLNHPYLKYELHSLRANGLIKKIGISVYTNNEMQIVTADKDIDVIQLPYNLLDNYNIRGPFIRHAKDQNKEIHIRSVFLQGLLFKDESSIPDKLISLIPYIRKIRSFCQNESIDLQSLALSYAIYDKCIDNVLIGVDTTDHLINDIMSIKELRNAFEFINHNIKVKETELLNPVNWK